MKRGRPKGSPVRQNITELLSQFGELHGYDVYKHYMKIFPKVTMRAVYYSLRNGAKKGCFKIAKVEKHAGGYSWGPEAQRVYYALGEAAKPVGDLKVKRYFENAKASGQGKMKVEIEYFEEKYANELSEMINRAVDEMEKANPDLDYALVREEDKPEELTKASKEGKVWVAKTDNKIIGTLSLIGNRLRRFFVHPDYQRRGIGRSMVENVVSYAKTCNMNELVVSAVLSAVPIYKKLGFEEGEIFLNREINQKEMKMKLLMKNPTAASGRVSAQ